MKKTLRRKLDRIKAWARIHKTLTKVIMGVLIFGGTIAYVVIDKYLWEKKYAALPTVRSRNGFHYKMDAEESTAYLFEYDTTYTETLVIPTAFRHDGKRYFVRRLMDGVFAGRKDIRRIDLPDELEIIGDEAFMGCENLEELMLPNTVTKIGKKAFKGCSNLNFLAIPGGVGDIYEDTFEGCSGLSVLMLGNSYAPLRFSKSWELRRVPVKTLFLGRECCQDNNRLRDDYDIFTDIKTLETLILGKVPINVDASLFLKDEGFCGCTNLKQIYCYSEEPYNLNTNAFVDSQYENVVLHVPLGTLQEYKDDWGWKRFKHIVEYDKDTLMRIIRR